ncbi:MAG: hypothetical protein IPO41_14495 [Acidobacteria bacterium]|nr:hypothetical protein [Acidobacteriota bacterium]
MNIGEAIRAAWGGRPGGALEFVVTVGEPLLIKAFGQVSRSPIPWSCTVTVFGLTFTSVS